MKRVAKADIEEVMRHLQHAQVLDGRDRFELYATLLSAGAQLDTLRARVREEIHADMARVGLGGPGEAPIALEERRRRA